MLNKRRKVERNSGNKGALMNSGINQGGSVITSNTGALNFDKRFVILFFSFMRTLRTTCRYLSAII